MTDHLTPPQPVEAAIRNLRSGTPEPTAEAVPVTPDAKPSMTEALAALQVAEQRVEHAAEQSVQQAAGMVESARAQAAEIIAAASASHDQIIAAAQERAEALLAERVMYAAQLTSGLVDMAESTIAELTEIVGAQDAARARELIVWLAESLANTTRTVASGR